MTSVTKIIKKSGPPAEALNDWSSVEGDDVHAAVVGQFMRLLETNATLHANNRAMRFYFLDLNTTLFANSTISYAWKQLQGTVSHNVIGSAVNTVSSQVFNDPPRIKIVTENGNGKLKRAARKLTQFTDGLLTEGGLKVEAPRCGIDGLVCGTGYLRTFNDAAGNPTVQHMWPNDVLVDLVDGDRMQPTEMFIRWRSDRQTLSLMYPGHDEELADASPIIALPNNSAALSTVPNVGVGECWKLPTPGQKNGRHVVWCSTCVLVDEPWDLPFIPVFAFRWQEDQVGYHGIGIPWQLQGIQQEINEMILYWVDTMRMNAMPRWSVEEGAMPPEAQWAQSGAVFTRPNGSNPPVALPINLMPMDFNQWIMGEQQWAFQQIGISEAATKATSNLGPNASGAAQREERDTQSIRLSMLSNRWDQLHIDVARAAIELTRKWAAEHGGFNKQVRGKQFLGSIRWSDCSIDQNAYTVEAFATSELPNSIAGRMQKVSELSQLGAIDRETTLQLLDVPDPDGEVQRLISDVVRLDMLIDDILDDEEYGTVDEFLVMSNPMLVMSIITQEINRAYTNDETPKAIELLNRLFSDCLDKIAMANASKAQLQPPPPAPAQGPGPVAPPQPIPPSAMAPQ